jgi:hypothetical protein
MSNVRLRLFLAALGLVVLTQIVGGAYLIRQVDTWCAQTNARLAVYTGE